MTARAMHHIPVRLRATNPDGTGATRTANPHLAALDDPWPDRPFREGHGWPLWIPPTGPSAYISGSFALNLPTIPGRPRLGDWHKDGTWWSPVYLDGNDQPVRTPVWGVDGATAAPGPPVLHDARQALAQVGHPAANRTTPVLAASVPQAIVDMAWGSLHGTDQQPCRHDIFRWTDAAAEEELRALARTVGNRISDPALLRQWRDWQEQALHGPDSFYDTPVTVQLNPADAANVSVPVVIKAGKTAR